MLELIVVHCYIQKTPSRVIGWVVICSERAGSSYFVLVSMSIRISDNVTFREPTGEQHGAKKQRHRTASLKEHAFVKSVLAARVILPMA